MCNVTEFYSEVTHISLSHTHLLCLYVLAIAFFWSLALINLTGFTVTDLGQRLKEDTDHWREVCVPLQWDLTILQNITDIHRRLTCIWLKHEITIQRHIWTNLYTMTLLHIPSCTDHWDMCISVILKYVYWTFFLVSGDLADHVTNFLSGCDIWM